MSIFTEDRVAFYVHLHTFEGDFDKSQSQLRAISSAWTATVLAAIAVLITTGATPIAVPKDGQLVPIGLIDIRSDALAYLRAIICLVGSAGVAAFWYIDQGVYQRLLHSVFAYGLFLESKDPSLPQIRSGMYWANLDVTNRLGIFYRAQFWLFVAVSLGSDIVGRALGHASPTWGVWWIIGVHFVLALAWDIFFSYTSPSLLMLIEDQYPEFAKELPVSRKAGIAGSDPEKRRLAFLARIRHQSKTEPSPSPPQASLTASVA
ncbi:hypothetical protein [Bradyrhizobium sp. ORS 285]|uniref:hypothetical protein n=1 Tax=Bradyrhizobium sp. ORS 285 TaxID=115808 RepID=UPI001112404F|nr:hypothetical protein [Bradyrhizobium sp. ORS 285]